MADSRWSNCSISQQDCAKYNTPNLRGSTPYTNTSCVQYLPWYQGDLGVCGWKGAPCIQVYNELDDVYVPVKDNCNSAPSISIGHICQNTCIDLNGDGMAGLDQCDCFKKGCQGTCGYGLGDRCPGSSNCNGVISCGNDGICGGKDAAVGTVPDPLVPLPTIPVVLPDPNVVAQLCVSNETYNTDGYFHCQSRHHHVNAALAGGISGTLAFIFIILSICWKCRRKFKRTPAPTPPPPSQWLPRDHRRDVPLNATEGWQENLREQERLHEQEQFRREQERLAREQEQFHREQERAHEQEQFRREQERLAREQEQFRREQERLAHEHEAARAVQERQLFEMHETQWTHIGQANDLRWDSFPWPMLQQPGAPREITTDAIRTYMLSPHHDQSMSTRDRIRRHILRWHSDHFDTGVLQRVTVSHSERDLVREGAGAVTRAVIALNEEMEGID